MRAICAIILVACQPVATAPSTPARAPVATVEETPARGDACQSDIPDCEAACALREVRRTAHLDWFDRRCAAVVLGKNPDKAVGYVPPTPVEVVPTPRPSTVDCEPPYTLDTTGRKKWKRECFD
jgi:hypothetical protein